MPPGQTERPRYAAAQLLRVCCEDEQIFVRDRERWTRIIRFAEGQPLPRLSVLDTMRIVQNRCGGQSAVGTMPDELGLR